MNLPQTPPSLQVVTEAAGPRLAEVMAHLGEVAKQDAYLPWDEIRRRPPPFELTHEEWWLLLKLSRSSRFRSIPLRDKQGRAFQLGLPDSLLAQLHEIDRGLGFAPTLSDAVTQPATRDQYIVSSLVQESITSSQLEGAATTREIAKEMLRSGRAPRDKSERMILNNYHTMQRIREIRDQALTPELVLTLHALVTEGTLEKTNAAGRFRRADEHIRVVDIEGTVFHDPPAANELPARMEAMCSFANEKTPDFFVHPVVRAVILHFWLAYDHPFVDGNGRTARALFYWCMLKEKYQLFEFISISQILLRAPNRYARAFLHTESDDNDLGYFLLHQAEVIREAVRALHDYVARKTSELRAAEQQLRGLERLNHRQQGLLVHALREPTARYLIRGHQRTQAISFQTARNDLFDLVARGLLEVKKAGRNNVFYVPGDLGDKLSGLTRRPVSPSPDQETLPLKLGGKPKPE